MESPILITKSVSAQRKLLWAHPIKIKWSREARRGAHCNHRKKGQLQTQQKMPPQERIKCRLQQGRMHIALLQETWPPLQLSQGETTITLNLCYSPVDFPFHHKSNVSPLCWAHLQFASSLQALNCNSLLFPGKPIFGGKVTDSFSFKVNNPKQVKPFKEISDSSTGASLICWFTEGVKRDKQINMARRKLQWIREAIKEMGLHC